MAAPSSPTSSVTSSTCEHKDLRLALLAELGTALRARSEAEHVYTAAAVGGFGAIAWGVAALRPENYFNRPYCERPAGAAIVGIFFVGVVIAIKIIREHRHYSKFRREQARIAKDLASLPGAEDIVPEEMMNPRAGRGFLFSMGVLVTAAIAAIIFCLSLISP